MIKTVTVSGITEVNFGGGDVYLREKYVWIKNNSAEIIYISDDENCTAGADGTASVRGGESRRVRLGHTNTLYFSGDGDIEIDTSDVAECPFKSDGKGGGGGTSDYTELTNKPKINNVTLIGNKSFEDLGLDLSQFLTVDDIEIVDHCTAAEIAASVAEIWG